MAILPRIVPAACTLLSPTRLTRQVGEETSQGKVSLPLQAPHGPCALLCWPSSSDAGAMDESTVDGGRRPGSEALFVWGPSSASPRSPAFGEALQLLQAPKGPCAFHYRPRSSDAGAMDESTVKAGRGFGSAALFVWGPSSARPRLPAIG